ncbi:uncharacterized protein LOC110298854 [Mus caroli]|uniref:Uncharacterized protein LOC110298854 n=1 Tax=Mus caroli TaxID=10089 RepID=A0A6P5Q3L8_MUSCR|nr:uncharacterized protein LOC110298854 [Mus caroli]
MDSAPCKQHSVFERSSLEVFVISHSWGLCVSGKEQRVAVWLFLPLHRERVMISASRMSSLRVKWKCPSSGESGGLHFYMLFLLVSSKVTESMPYSLPIGPLNLYKREVAWVSPL